MMVSKTDSTRCGPLISVTWWLLLVVGEGWGGEGMGVNGHNMLNIHFECWTSMKEEPFGIERLHSTITVSRFVRIR